MIQSACPKTGGWSVREIGRETPPSVVFYEMSVFFIKNRKINLHKIKTDAILYKREFL